MVFLNFPSDLSGKDALKDQIKTEDDDGSYDYYFLQQVPKSNLFNHVF